MTVRPTSATRPPRSAAADAAVAARPRSARSDPVGLGAGPDRRAAVGRVRDDVAVVRRRGRDGAPARPPRHRAGRHRRDPGPARGADGPALQPLRRRARGRRDALDLAAVRADRARRRARGSRRGGHQVEHPGSRRRPARLGRAAAGRDQAVHRGLRGDRQRGADELPAHRSGALPGRRARDRRHGIDPARRPDAHDGAARDGERDGRGPDARIRQAQRPVRRGGARRAARTAARAELPARRAGRRGASPASGATSGRESSSPRRISASSAPSSTGCR